MSLYLVCVKALPGTNLKETIFRAWAAIKEGVKDTAATALLGFRVVGENQLVTVLDGPVIDVQKALDNMSAAVGESTDVTCTPMRSVDSFAKNVLGCDEAICVPAPIDNMVVEGHVILWVVLDVEYQGLTFDEMINIWGQEDTFALTLRAKGQFNAQIYKVLGKRQMQAFMAVPNHEAFDDTSFQLPIMKLNGNNSHLTVKSLLKLD